MMRRLLAVAMLMAALCAAQAAPGPAVKPGAGTGAPAALTANESKALDLMLAMFEELNGQLADAEARVRVVREMQDKLRRDFGEFQARATAARGYQVGQAVIDPQTRSVVAVSAAKPEAKDALPKNEGKDAPKQ